MKHYVELSNGETLEIHEGDNIVHIGTVDDDGDSDYCICSISADGVLAAAFSGEASALLTRHLREDEP